MMRNIKVLLRSIPDDAPGFARGGLAVAARHVQAAGRDGDSILLHVNPVEFRRMRAAWGEPTINPATGIYEYSWLAKIFSGIGSVIKNIVSSDTFKSVASSAGQVGAQSLISSGLTKAGLSPGLANAVGGAASGAVAKNSSSNSPFGSAIGAGLGSAATGKGFLPGALASLARPAARPNAAPQTSGSAAPDSLPEEGQGVTPAAPQSAWDQIKAWAKEHPYMATAGALGSGYLLTTAAKEQAAATRPTPPPQYPVDTSRIPVSTWNRTPATPLIDYARYGQGPEQSFFNDNGVPIVNKARGGLLPGQAHLTRPVAGTLVRGPGDGRSDSIHAKLSDGEYVMDAETVAMLGDGSTDAGAKKLDMLRSNLRKHKGKALASGKISAPAKTPEQYMHIGGLAHLAAGGRAPLASASNMLMRAVAMRGKQ